MYYTQAIEAFDNLKEFSRADSVRTKFEVAKSQSLESRGKKVQAEDTETQARELYAGRNFQQAQAAANNAKALYLELGMKNKADEMDILL